MYIEIAGRQTGKTTKLVNHIIGNHDTNCIIITMNFGMGKYIRKVLAKHMDVSNIIFLSSKEELDSKLKGVEQFPNIYVDEFDFIDWDFPIVKNGYYTTTPSRIRTRNDIDRWRKGMVQDKLLDLLNANDGTYNCSTRETFMWGWSNERYTT